MSKKKDICSLADGKNILEIAYYGPGDHSHLALEMGAHWFEKEILVPFLGQYSKDKTIAVIDYKEGGATRQHFDLGNSPEEAVNYPPPKGGELLVFASTEPLVLTQQNREA